MMYLAWLGSHQNHDRNGLGRMGWAMRKWRGFRVQASRLLEGCVRLRPSVRRSLKLSQLTEPETKVARVGAIVHPSMTC